MAHVLIDREICISCGTCWLECPDIFEENPDDHKSQVVKRLRVGTDESKGEVFDERSCAEVAAELCPVVAITVRD